MLRFISDRRLYAQQIKLFIQEIATQAIVNDESMIAKEIGYEGFGATPYLSESLFGDWFILRNYDPLHKMRFGVDAAVTEGYVSRLNGACRMIVDTAIKNQEFWPQGYEMSVHSAYEALFRNLSYSRYKDASSSMLAGLSFGIRQIYQGLDKALSNMPLERQVGLYATKERPYAWDNLVATVAAIVYESLESIANGFNGIDDSNWVHAISTFMDVFPTIGHPSTGFDPFQQQVAVRLIDKLRQNMQGYYPAISRVLLAVVGPYDRHENIEKGSAFGILRDAMYKELLKLKDLYRQKPDQIDHYFPPQVKYNPDADTLTFTYRMGDPITTNLSELDIDEINLLDPRYRQWTPGGDAMGWPL